MMKCMSSKYHGTVEFFLKRKVRIAYILLSYIQNTLSVAQRAVIQLRQELLIKISH